MKKASGFWMWSLILTTSIAALVITVDNLGCSGSSQAAQDVKIAADQAQLAMTLAEYTSALDNCRAIGKDAGVYSAYEKCAHDMDIRYGRKDGFNFNTDGGK